MMDYEGMAREILSPLFNPEPHPFQEEWSDAHSMSSETLVNKLAKALESVSKQKDERIKELEEIRDDREQRLSDSIVKQDTLRQEIEKLRQQSWNTGEAWRCEQHPDKTFPHGDCIGPGMPDYQGRSTIKSLRLRLARMELAVKEIKSIIEKSSDEYELMVTWQLASKALEEDSHES